MSSGIKALRRLEVRDEHGVATTLLIGHTDDNELVIGIAPQRGEAVMAILDFEEVGRAFKLMRGAMRGEMP